MSRTLNHAVAAAIAAALWLANLITALVLLPRGSAALAAYADQPPYAVVIIEVILGALGIVAAYGVLRIQRWGIVLTLILCVLNALVSLPGVAFAPTTSGKVTSALALVASGVVIYLILRRDSRASSPEVSPTPAHTTPAA